MDIETFRRKISVHKLMLLYFLLFENAVIINKNNFCCLCAMKIMVFSSNWKPQRFLNKNCAHNCLWGPKCKQIDTVFCGFNACDLVGRQANISHTNIIVCIEKGFTFLEPIALKQKVKVLPGLVKFTWLLASHSFLLLQYMTTWSVCMAYHFLHKSPAIASSALPKRFSYGWLLNRRKIEFYSLHCIQ